jgi:hypothetical protein
VRREAVKGEEDLKWKHNKWVWQRVMQQNSEYALVCSDVKVAVETLAAGGVVACLMQIVVHLR